MSVAGALTLREIAHALGGEVSGHQVLCPGPGHSRTDRSLSIRLSHQAPHGFLTHSFAGDDWRTCLDHVADRLHLPRPGPAMPNDRPRNARHEPRGDHQDDQARIARAAAIWNEGQDPRGTIVERYLAGRGLALPAEVATAAIRFHPACPWRDEARGETIRVPAMLASMRSVSTDQVTAIHRTRLTQNAAKVERRMLGIAAGAAVKLDPNDMVTAGLAIGEGVETCLAAREMGLRPTWALCSTSGLGVFPVLPGIGSLTLLAEHDPASARAVESCADRWHAAGREVLIVEPTTGSDLNDTLREAG